MAKKTEAEYEQMMRDAEAPWQNYGLGVRGPLYAAAALGGTEIPSSASRIASKERNPDRVVPRPPIPDPILPTLPALSAPPGTSGPSTIYSFMMEDATDNEGAKVLIRDGEVSANGADGVVPSGMGNDDFILNIAADGDDVWVEVTYDTTTLTISSATINTGTGIPNSTLGDAYILLGYVNFGPINSNTGLPTSCTPHNTQCGDINIAFMYGAFNAAPALFLLSQIDAPQPLS